MATHHDADGRVEVEPHHRPRTAALSAWREGKDLPWVSLDTSGAKPGCSYGRGKFSLARRMVPPRKTKAGTRLARAMSCIKSRAAAPSDGEHREPPEIQQYQKHRIAGKGHGREPAVQGITSSPQGGMCLQPAQQCFISFRCHAIPSLKNRCSDSFPHQTAQAWNPCAGRAG